MHWIASLTSLKQYRFIFLFLKKARVSIIHVKSIFFLSMVPEVAVIMLLVVYAGEKNPYQVQNNLLSVGVL